MKTGILGGTFDPIHIGHLFLAHEARDVFELDRVIFVPSGRGPHKRNQKTAPGPLRLAMVKAATQDFSYFEVSDVEIDREGYSYTVDTMEVLRTEFPEDEFYFITGADAFLTIETWLDYDKLLQNMHFVAAYRPVEGQGVSEVLDQMEALVDRLSGAISPVVADRVHTMALIGLEVSSSELRRRLEMGRQVHCLVPERVLDLVKEHGLYGVE